jgi:hypothetical protein
MAIVQRIFLLLFLSLLPAAVISGQENVSQSTNVSSDPDIAFDKQGRAVVVWTEADLSIPNNSEIFFSVLQNGFWSEGRATFSGLYYAEFPALCIDRDDIFHMVYTDGWNSSSRDIFYRRLELNNGFWSNIERVLLHVLDGTHPSLAVDSQGTVHTLWEQVVATADQIKIVGNSRPEGQPWGDKWVNVSQNVNSKTAFPSLRETGGILHACWMDNRNGTWDIFYSQRISGSWSLPEGLGGPEEKFHPALSLDQNGQVHIIYGSDSGNIYHARRTNQSWSQPQLVAPAAYPGGPLDVQTFPNNTLHAVWPETTETGVALFYSRAAADGLWQQPFKIVGGTEAASPRVVSDPSGQAHVVWADQGISDRTDIFHLQVIPPGTPPTAKMVNSASEGIVPFIVTFDASLSSTSQDQLISFWWDFGDGTEKEEGIQVAHAYETEGTFTARLYATDSQLNLGTVSTQIQILSGPFPPLAVTVRKAENKSLFYREDINLISWVENPKNNAFSPVARYIVYRRLKSQEEDPFLKIGQVGAGTFAYVDRLFLSPGAIDIYAYAVSAVDDQGREGPKVEALPFPAENQKSIFNRKRRNLG